MSQTPPSPHLSRAGAFILFLFLAPFVQGAQVWVSTSISSSFTGDMIDVATDDPGKLWITFSQSDGLNIATASGSNWFSEPIFSSPYLLFNDLDSDRRIVVDKLSVSHIFFLDSLWRVIHTYSPFTGLQREMAAYAGSTVHETTRAIDATNGLHLAYPVPGSTEFRVVYATKSGAGWSSEIVITPPFAANPRLPHVSLDVTSDGTPFMSYSGVVGDPVKVLTKKPGGWTEIHSFSGNWWWPTLRVDGTNHLHLVMTSTATNTPIARYLVMDSAGTVQQDSSFTLSELAATSPPRPSLAIDRANRAHIAVGSAYIKPPANPVYLPSNYSVDSVTKIALTKNNEPYFVGVSSMTPSLLRLTAHVDSPGSAQVVERTTHSLTWNFTPATGSVSEHRLIRVSDGVDVSGPLGITASSFTQTGLSPNESQTLVVRAVFPGVFADSVASTGHTLGVMPTDIRLNRSSGNTLAVSWAPAGNAAGTLYRLSLIPPTGTGIVQETTNQTAQFQLLDPAIPYAVTLAAVGGDGVETFVSTLSKTAQDGAGAAFSFELPDGLGVDISIQGTGSGPALAVTVASADSFPTAPLSFGAFTPAGVGFDVPTSQAVPSGQTVILTLRYPEGRLNSTDALTLARFNSDRNQWVPLATQVDGTNRRLTASTRALGLFQVMVRTSRPTDVGGARVSPNPFRPTLHTAMAIQEVPAGTQVRIYSDGGRLVREFTTSEGNATWDGRDGDGNPVHSGTYVMRLEQNGATKRVRFVLER